MVAHLTSKVEQLVSYVEPKPGDTVLDIGCNDGTLLNCYGAETGLIRVGIDPSAEKFRSNYQSDIRIAYDFFSEQGDTRAPISLWQWAYDKIQHPERQETCTALCNSPGNCTSAEQDSIDICQAVELNDSDNQSKCENTPSGVLPCQYFPENIPLQMSIQNQERYLIVNQDYGANLFS